MKSGPARRSRLGAARLYLIIGPADERVVRAAVEGGADVVQVRWKGAARDDLVRLVRRVRRFVGSNMLVVVNDDPEAARGGRADGVHVGAGDPAVAEARQVVGRSRLVGATVRDVAEVVRAVAAGADYVGAGTAFPSATRPDLAPRGPAAVAACCLASPVPAFAIGGITIENVDDLLRRGVRRVAVSAALTGAADPAGACRALRQAIDRYWSADEPLPHPGVPAAASGGAP